MKYLLVIGDGMADHPVPSLGGLTPLQYAKKPVMDRLASHGRLGRVQNCPRELPPGSETAILSIFGCDPLRYFTGRSPMEAASVGVPLNRGDSVFRCNLTALDEGDMPLGERRLLSHSAGSIAGEEALAVCSALLADDAFSAALRRFDMELYPAPNFRPLLVWHRDDIAGLELTPPHDHLGEKCGPLLPKGTGCAKELAELIAISNRCLEHHPVTLKRRAEGKLGCNSVWFWAGGTACSLPSFAERYGMNGSVVSAVPICHGIGALCGLEKIEVEGATGEIDTNFEGKRDAVIACLKRKDFVCLHLEAPDECTHNGDLAGKVRAIEWLDSRLLSPIVSYLENTGEAFRILLLSDHKTLTETRGHNGEPVPYILFDSRIDTCSGCSYDEPSADLLPEETSGVELLKLLLEKK